MKIRLSPFRFSILATITFVIVAFIVVSFKQDKATKAEASAKHILPSRPEVALTDRVPIEQNPYFDQLTAMLGALVAKHGKEGGNTLFIAPTAKETTDTTYVYWVEDKSILVVKIDNCVNEQCLEWAYGKARIDLENDVVPTQEDVGTSTFLVSKPWAEYVRGLCLREGYRMALDR